MHRRPWNMEDPGELPPSPSMMDNMNDSLCIDNQSENYDYLDISDRASFLLKEPHRIIALILVALVISTNILSLVAILNIKGRLTTHFRFLLNLACSDMLVAVSVLSHVINKVVNPLYLPGLGPEKERILSRCAFVVIKALNTTGLIITLLNLMGMSFDAYIAMLKPSYYISVPYVRRATCLMLSLWLIAFICGFSDFILSSFKFKDSDGWRYSYNYCEFVYLSKYQEEYTVFAIALACLLTMTILYCLIYKEQRGKRGSRLYQQRRNSNACRSRRVLLTTTIIIVTFIIYWLPLCALNISLIVITKVNEKLLTPDVIQRLITAEQYLFDLLLLNGIFDPVIYTVRIPEVQHFYKCTICRKHSTCRHCNSSFRGAAGI